MKKSARWLAAFCLVALLAAPAAQAAEPGLLGWDVLSWFQGWWSSLVSVSDSASGDDTTTTTSAPEPTTTSEGGPHIDPLGLQANPGAGTGSDD